MNTFFVQNKYISFCVYTSIFIYTLCILFCVYTFYLYTISIYLYIISCIPLLHYCLIIAYFVFLLFANPYTYILKCDIFPFYSCRVCILNIYIYMNSILFIFVLIVSCYFRSCLSLWVLNHLVCMNKYISILIIPICV